MFFAGLIGAFIVFRFGSLVWPPPGLPHLPVAVTWANTSVLLSSAVTMWWAVSAIRGGDAQALTLWTTVTLALGTLFVAVQGAEWVRLIEHGLTLTSGTYGATFYVLIGTHALHVVAAILWLGFIWNRCRLGRYSAAEHVGVQVSSIYWFYVCGLWVLLFGLVYQ
jgi:cytochrome c oxidase subunit 3